MRFFALSALLLSLACSGDQTSTTHPVTSPANGGEPSEPETAEETSENTSAEASANLVVGTDECVSDADCVAAACCHATACVVAANAPSCADAMCTQDCQYNTLDCGGGCLCHEGHCAARLSEVPAGIREAMEQPVE